MKNKMMNVALIMTLVCSIMAGAMICGVKNNGITDQDIAEFAAAYDYKNDQFEEMTVEVIKTDHNESYGCETIDCIIYEDGKACYYKTINKDWYKGLMGYDRENS